jgi:hypothetical protein
MTADKSPTWRSLLDARRRIVSDAAWTALQEAEAALERANARLAGADVVERNLPLRITNPTESQSYIAFVEAQQRAAAKQAAEAKVDREFCEQMAVGPWQATGRRGSPTAPQSDIPTAAWPHLREIDWGRSTLVEPDGTIWYDVSIERAATPTKTGVEQAAIEAVPAQTAATAEPTAADIEPAAPATAAVAPRIRRQRRQPQSDLIRAAIQEVWRDGVVPDDIGTSTVMVKTKPYFQRRSVAQPDWSTFDRVLGRAPP